MEAFKQLKIAIRLLLILTILTGLAYPALVTYIAQWFFPFEANGSMIHYHNKILGSQLIGQSFTNIRYFWGRPSATLPFPYNAALSSGSNLGPSNPALLNVVKMRIAALQKSDPKKQSSIPVDLVTASASGLDPDISPLAALYQAPRIAKARKIPEEKIIKLIQQLTKKRDFGILGEPRINVLQLNIALDNL